MVFLSFGFSVFFPREKWAKSQKTKEGDRGGERGNGLQTNPWILKTSVRQRTELAIGWDSQILLTCVDQRTLTSEAFEGFLQKALIFPHQMRGDSHHFLCGQNTENPVSLTFFGP